MKILYQCRIIKKDSQSTSVEKLEQQVLKQNELAKSVDTEETKQDDKKIIYLTIRDYTLCKYIACGYSPF